MRLGFNNIAHMLSPTRHRRHKKAPKEPKDSSKGAPSEPVNPTDGQPQAAATTSAVKAPAVSGHVEPEKKVDKTVADKTADLLNMIGDQRAEIVQAISAIDVDIEETSSNMEMDNIWYNTKSLIITPSDSSAPANTSSDELYSERSSGSSRSSNESRTTTATDTGTASEPSLNAAASSSGDEFHSARNEIPGRLASRRYQQRQPQRHRQATPPPQPPPQPSVQQRLLSAAAAVPDDPFLEISPTTSNKSQESLEKSQDSIVMEMSLPPDSNSNSNSKSNATMVLTAERRAPKEIAIQTSDELLKTNSGLRNSDIQRIIDGVRENTGAKITVVIESPGDGQSDGAKWSMEMSQCTDGSIPQESISSGNDFELSATASNDLEEKKCKSEFSRIVEKLILGPDGYRFVNCEEIDLSGCGDVDNNDQATTTTTTDNANRKDMLRRLDPYVKQASLNKSSPTDDKAVEIESDNPLFKIPMIKFTDIDDNGKETINYVSVKPPVPSPSAMDTSTITDPMPRPLTIEEEDADEILKRIDRKAIQCPYINCNRLVNIRAYMAHVIEYHRESYRSPPIHECESCSRIVHVSQLRLNELTRIGLFLYRRRVLDGRTPVATRLCLRNRHLRPEHDYMTEWLPVLLMASQVEHECDFETKRFFRRQDPESYGKKKAYYIFWLASLPTSRPVYYVMHVMDRKFEMHCSWGGTLRPINQSQFPRRFLKKKTDTNFIYLNRQDINEITFGGTRELVIEFKLYERKPAFMRENFKFKRHSINVANESKTSLKMKKPF